MRVLVTGDLGFIGGHLRHELVKHGHDVYGLDYKRGDYQDLTVPGVFAKNLFEIKPDKVVHLAAQYGRLKGEQDVEFTIRENGLMNAYIARECHHQEVPVLYTSTSEIYGDQGETELTEETVPVLPHNLYGLTKRWGEEVLQLYAPEGLQICRLSMPYGPGGAPGFGMNALHNVLHQAIYRKNIVVHKNAERSWVWVGDLAYALRLVMESPKPGLWNIGREDRRMQMLDIAEWACEMTGCPQECIQLVDPPKAQTVVKRMNCDKVTREFGWAPTVELEEGIVPTIEYLRKYNANCEWIGA